MDVCPVSADWADGRPSFPVVVCDVAASRVVADIKGHPSDSSSSLSLMTIDAPWAVEAVPLHLRIGDRPVGHAPRLADG